MNTYGICFKMLLKKKLGGEWMKYWENTSNYWNWEMGTLRFITLFCRLLCLKFSKIKGFLKTTGGDGEQARGEREGLKDRMGGQFVVQHETGGLRTNTSKSDTSHGLVRWHLVTNQMLNDLCRDWTRSKGLSLEKQNKTKKPIYLLDSSWTSSVALITRPRPML